MVEPEALRQAGLGHAFGPNGLIDGSLGFHRKYLLCIVDECCGVPAELWEAAEPLASNAAGIGFASGNRTDPASHFAEVCKSGSGWEVQQMSAYPTLRTPVRRFPMTAELGRLHVEPCRGDIPALTHAGGAVSG